MEKNQQIAASVLELVGGKENISFVTHCMTRLRLNLKDESIVDDEKVKKIKGVLGIAHSGGQYQIIIGQNVPKVYKAVCETGGFQQEAAIEENLDQPKEKLTLKTIGSNIMNYMSGAMTQLIGVMIGAAMFKTVLVLIGPDMLKLAVERDLQRLLLFSAGVSRVFGGQKAGHQRHAGHDDGNVAAGAGFCQPDRNKGVDFDLRLVERAGAVVRAIRFADFTGGRDHERRGNVL